MLFKTVITIAIVLSLRVSNGENIAKEIRSNMAFPVPFELPNRNDRSEQCWLRVEDAELTETITIYCYIAQAFLRNYIHDYNSRKMTDDDVDVSLWREEPRLEDDIITPKPAVNPKSIKNWKLTTILDPITGMRLYVTQQAVCRLIMYNREGMTNYNINCEKILYYVNYRMNGVSSVHHVSPEMFAITCIALLVLGL